MRNKLLIGLLTLGMLAPTVLTACGGGSEGKGMTREEIDAMRKKKKKKKKTTQAGDPAQLVSINIKNKSWETIRRHFEKVLDQKHTSPKNVFAPQANTYVQRPVLEEPPEAADVDEGKEPDDEPQDIGPLQQHSLKEYKLLMIMSGTAIPKAVVVDPKGNAFVVTIDTQIGNKGGIVKSITQYTIMVQEPEADKPQKLSIKPPFLDLVSQARTEGDLGRDDQYLPADILPSDTRSLLAPEDTGAPKPAPGR